VTDINRAAAIPVPRHPILALLASVPVVCFSGALLTDIAYSQTSDMQWANFSAWLLAFGMVFAVLAVIAWALDFRGRRARRQQTRAWPYGVANVVVLVLALINNFVHSRDAWTSVVPTGLVLSALTVLAMIVTALLGRASVHRNTVQEIR
jgi:uncharacterized membrane protein